MDNFTLDARLKADTLEIVDWELCRVLRMNDQNYPWLILVPRRDAIRDIIDLSVSDQTLLWREVDRASRILQLHTKAHKLNIAALGNVVPQLHVHVIGRFTTDAAWPRPIWGIVPAMPFPPDEASRDVLRWRSVLGH